MLNPQTYTDKFLAKFFLPFIPKTITPNQVTEVRILLLPIIFYLIVQHFFIAGLILFLIAALSDALDGAMARTRNQVTDLGKILDPIADRGLIFLVAILFIPELFGQNLLYLIIVLEFLNGLMAYRSRRKIKKVPAANWSGKVKMQIQVAAFSLIFVGYFFRTNFWFETARILLYISLGFTFVECFLYPKPKLATELN